MPRYTQPRKPLAERFWPKVDQSGGPDACWPWRGALHRSGYGIIMVYRTPDATRMNHRHAHTVSLELALGRHIRPGYGALHHCDNPPCVNPKHLYEGTHRDNMRDLLTRHPEKRFTPQQMEHIRTLARRHPPRQDGERNNAAKLDEAKVRLIRASEAPEGELARQFGVSPSTIGFVRRRQRWQHVA